MNAPNSPSTQHVDLVEPIGPGPSPFLPRNLLLLFTRPSEFFTSHFSLSHKPNVILVTLCLGIAATLERIDSSLMKEEFGRPRPGWGQLTPFLLDSWFGLWVYLLVGGAVAGVIYWWIGGWWFRVRVRWSGETKVNRSAARLVMVYSAFVYSGPAVGMVLLQTLVYPNYAVAYANDPIAPLGVIIFSFWSIGTGYIGVRSTFSVSVWKARIWFLILPALFYMAAFGLIAALLGMVPLERTT